MKKSVFNSSYSKYIFRAAVSQTISGTKFFLLKAPPELNFQCLKNCLKRFTKMYSLLKYAFYSLYQFFEPPQLCKHLKEFNKFGTVEKPKLKTFWKKEELKLKK